MATADRVMIFDFHRLGKVGPRGRGFEQDLSKPTFNLIKQLFQSEDICKVGWGFSSSDTTMLKKSGGGNIEIIVFLLRVCIIYQNDFIN